MAENSAIEWTDHTFNPWVGCAAVSPGCDHCYARVRNEQLGHDFSVLRRTTAQNWRKPLKWDREAGAAGVRRRVFCASWADVFDYRAPVAWRADLWDLISMTRSLDWLLLTKRPQNIAKMLPMHPSYQAWPWPHVWLGTTAENQAAGDRDEESSWGWPLTDIEILRPFVPAKGAQGFWQWTPPRD